MSEPNVTPNILLVAATSPTAALAGSLTHVLTERGTAEMHAIGAGAISQAVKAIAVSRGHLVTNGADLVMFPAFFNKVVDNRDLTGLKFIVMLSSVYRSSSVPYSSELSS